MELKIEQTVDNSQAIESSREVIRQLRAQEDVATRSKRIEEDAIKRVARSAEDAAKRQAGVAIDAASRQARAYEDAQIRMARVAEDAATRQKRAAEDAANKSLAAAERAAQQQSLAVIREARLAADAQIREANRAAAAQARAYDLAAAAHEKAAARGAKQAQWSASQVTDSMITGLNGAKDASAGLASVLGLVGAAGAGISVVTRVADSITKSMEEAVERSRELSKQFIDLQGQTRGYATAAGLKAGSGTALEMAGLASQTGLSLDTTTRFSELFAGSAGQFAGNLAGGDPKEMARLREMLGKKVALAGGDLSQGEQMAQLAAAILPQGSSTKSAGDVYGRIAGVMNTLEQGSSGDPKILLREMMQTMGNVSSGQLTVEQAAALTASMGNVMPGTAGQGINQAMRVLTDKKNALYKTAGLAEGMNGIQGLERVFGAMDQAAGQGRGLSEWLAEQGVDSSEERRALLVLRTQRNQGTIGANLKRAAEAPAGDAAVSALDTAFGDPNNTFLRNQVLENQITESKMRKARDNAPFETQRLKAQLALENAGRGAEDIGATADRQSSWSVGGIYDWITSGGNAQEVAKSGYEKELAAQIRGQLGQEQAAQGSVAGKWLGMAINPIYTMQLMYGEQRAARGTDAASYGDMVAGAGNLHAGLGPTSVPNAAGNDPQMERQNGLLSDMKEILLLIASSSNGGNLVPKSSRPRTVAPPGKPPAEAWR